MSRWMGHCGREKGDGRRAEGGSASRDSFHGATDGALQCVNIISRVHSTVNKTSRISTAVHSNCLEQQTAKWYLFRRAYDHRLIH